VTLDESRTDTGATDSSIVMATTARAFVEQGTEAITDILDFDERVFALQEQLLLTRC